MIREFTTARRYWLTLILLAGIIPAGYCDDITAAKQKIAALALKDDSLSRAEQPETWLLERQEQFRAELIAGLDNPTLRIAEGCLGVLDKAEASPDVREALIRIARRADHPICAKATISLCRYASQEGVDSVLQEALADPERFSDPRDRATVAEALGQKETAVELLAPLLNTLSSDYDKLKVIERLGKIRHRSAIAPLEHVSQDEDWGIAAQVYLAMAEIDPQGYGLTADQETFMKDAGRGFKANRPTYVEHWRKLAELNRTEIRPYVLRMLESDRPSAALVILQFWQDKEALEDIWACMMENRLWRFCEFAVAYLDIEGGSASCKRVFGLPQFQRDRFELEHIAGAVAESVMSKERKLSVLRSIREQFGRKHPTYVPNALSRAGDDKPFLLKSLMSEETDIIALGHYARSAGNDETKSYTTELRDTLKAIAKPGAIVSQTALPARYILEACAQYEMPDVVALTDRLLTEEQCPVRLVAAKISATLGGKRSEALRVLREHLAGEDRLVRKEASDHLRSIPCQTEQEKREREQAVLELMGTPQEDYALRILTTCGGQETVRKLTPIMDADDIGHAVHAAWVLAQLSDERIANTALRRLAIHAMYHHQVYQMGSGIDFQIAPDLSFHQTTVALNPGLRREHPTAVHIPDELLTPFSWDASEQAFAVGAYRYTRLRQRRGIGDVMKFPIEWHRWRRPVELDSSHIPLLEVIAREDLWIEAFHVKGRKIAHFPNRCRAAQTIAEITGESASYVGLEDEEIRTDKPHTEPYDDQNSKIARYLLDLIQSRGPLEQPEGDPSWQRLSLLNNMLRQLYGTSRLGFGPEFKEALLAEAQRLDLTKTLKDAGYRLWRDVSD